MILKIILMFVMLGTIYGVTAFLSPDTASTIDSTLGIDGFSENIRGGKSTFDASITDIPSLNEFKSGALDMVDTTKQTIDSVRGGAQKIENTYTGARDTYDEAKETFDSVKGTVDDLSGKMQEFEGAMQGVRDFAQPSE